MKGPRKERVRRRTGRERRAVERCILRCLRGSYLGEPGQLNKETQAQLYGLESARRGIK